MNLPRPEYPRPEFVRPDWQNLNGTWEFDFDDKNVGLKQKWFNRHIFSRRIIVPFSYQSQASGIGESDFHDVVWYRRTFTLRAGWRGRRILLHFGAVDYRAWVWVNKILVAYHEGGHTPFRAEITHALRPGENQVVVRVLDLSRDLEQPRGKQFWEENPKEIFYTGTTGIWQTVWLEPVARTFLERVKVTPNIQKGQVTVDYMLNNGSASQHVEVEIYFEGRQVARERARVQILQRLAVFTVTLDDFAADPASRLWSPEDPNLYELMVRVSEEGRPLDEVWTYFGMREVSLEKGQIRLNGRPYYMRLVLDQGYHPEGLLTFPADEDLRRDAELTKAMGFNGVRKHQKIEDPRYLYWADHLGLLVWEEMPNSHTFTDRAVRRIVAELQEAIERDYNHPCIVAWVPINESMGVPRLATDVRQPHHVTSLYYLTKSLDPTRLVIKDGWEHTISDLLTIHDYAGSKEVLKNRYSSLRKILRFKPSRRRLYVPGFRHHGEPILVSECGGIAYRKSDWVGWGYTRAASEADFAHRYYSVVSALLESPLLQGFCYTQLTDVEQEINGLLTYDRQPKIPIDLIRRINSGETLELPPGSGPRISRRKKSQPGLDPEAAFTRAPK